LKAFKGEQQITPKDDFSTLQPSNFSMTDENLNDLRLQIENFVEAGEVEELQAVLVHLHPSDIADLFPRLGRL